MTSIKPNTNNIKNKRRIHVRKAVLALINHMFWKYSENIEMQRKVGEGRSLYYDK